MQVEHGTYRQKDSHRESTLLLLPNEIIFVPVACLNLHLFYPQCGDVIITWLTKSFCSSGSRMAGLTFSCGRKTMTAQFVVKNMKGKPELNKELR